MAETARRGILEIARSLEDKGQKMAEAGFYADKIDVHGDGTVVIYRRADAAKKGVWQARIRIPGATGYTTRSTKETDEQRARAKALELRDDALVNVKLGSQVPVRVFPRHLLAMEPLDRRQQVGATTSGSALGSAAILLSLLCSCGKAFLL